MSLGSFSSRVRQLRGASPCDLEALTANIVTLPETPAQFRNCIFTPPRIFWLFLSQTLSAAQTCRESLRQAQALLSYNDEKIISSNTSAYCQARSRLPHSYAQAAYDSSVENLRPYEAASWCGRKVKVTDGTTLSMADTPQNQKEYPQPKHQKKGCGFPIMRLVAMFSLSTGAILNVAKGAYAVAERTLWRQLWDVLEKGDVMLADRGFCSYADYWILLQRGVDSVMRLHARRSVGVKEIKRLGKNDVLVEWIKSSWKPKWLSFEDWSQLPASMLVRHVTIQVQWPGFRTDTITIATTLLDPVEYPAEAFAELYLRRWRVELFLRDIKITMKMDVLRCLTPAMIHKELTMHLIAYNLVRALMTQASQQYNVDAARISFAGAVATIRQWAPKMALAPSDRKRDKMFQDLLFYIAHDRTPNRPNRVEPRAKKRRPKKYKLLNKPRSELKEIMCSNRYTNPLS